MKRLLLLICWAKIGKITTAINESDIKKKVKQNSMFTVKFFVLFLFFVFCFVVVVCKFPPDVSASQKVDVRLRNLMQNATSVFFGPFLLPDFVDVAFSIGL